LKKALDALIGATFTHFAYEDFASGDEFFGVLNLVISITSFYMAFNSEK
jgi:hypothetical protein